MKLDKIKQGIEHTTQQHTSAHRGFVRVLKRRALHAVVLGTRAATRVMVYSATYGIDRANMTDNSCGGNPKMISTRTLSSAVVGGETQGPKTETKHCETMTWSTQQAKVSRFLHGYEVDTGCSLCTFWRLRTSMSLSCFLKADSSSSCDVPRNENGNVHGKAAATKSTMLQRGPVNAP